jgi:ankyrin repeat protein
MLLPIAWPWQQTTMLINKHVKPYIGLASIYDDALLYETRQGNISNLEKLVSFGANVQFPVKRFLSNHDPVKVAIQSKRWAALFFFKKQGVPVNFQEKTLLEKAVEDKDFQAAHYILQKGVIPSGRLLLIETSEDILHILLQHGAKPTVANDKGLTALHLAATNGFSSLFIPYINAGAEFGRSDKNGKTPLYLICTLEDITKMKNLISTFLQAGIDIDMIDEKGSTCLHYATRYKVEPTILYLLENGANPMIETRENLSAYKRVFHMPGTFTTEVETAMRKFKNSKK